MGLSKSMKTFILIALVASLFLAIFISPFASSFPDGLEKVAEGKGFLEKGEEWQAWKFSPIPDYGVPGLGEGALATGLAGLFGTLAVFVLGYGVAFLVRSRQDDKKLEDPREGSQRNRT